MPNRTLRDGIKSSGTINSLTDRAYRLYINLISTADDFGCVEWGPVYLKAHAVPLLQWTLPEVAEAMAEVVEKKAVRLYRHGGKEYAAVEKWEQRRNAKNPKWPVPPWGFDGPESHVMGGYVAPRARPTAEKAQPLMDRPAPRRNGSLGHWSTEDDILARAKHLGVETTGQSRDALIRACNEESEKRKTHAS